MVFLRCERRDEPTRDLLILPGVRMGAIRIGLCKLRVLLKLSEVLRLRCRSSEISDVVSAVTGVLGAFATVVRD